MGALRLVLLLRMRMGQATLRESVAAETVYMEFWDMRWRTRSFLEMAAI
jgi:hypothetical protein